MLILSRKIDEPIILLLPNGDRVEIVLTEYDGRNTKVGIDAPQDIEIWREEILSQNL